MLLYVDYGGGSCQKLIQSHSRLLAFENLKPSRTYTALLYFLYYKLNRLLYIACGGGSCQKLIRSHGGSFACENLKVSITYIVLVYL